MSPAIAVLVVGLVLLCLGVALVAHPAGWARAIARSDRQAMQALGGAVRVLMGLALVYGADATRYVSGVHAFGLVLVAVGVMTLWVGHERFSSWIEGWLAGSLVLRLRLGGLLSVIVGAFLVFAAVE
jgi:uncharacterized membrane protein HdeD (DUF308 family)